MGTQEYHKLRFEGEEKQEETLFFLRAHVITNLGWILIVIVFATVPILVSFIPFEKLVGLDISSQTIFLVLLLWYLVLAGFAFQQFLHWHFNIYILTSKRIVDIDFFNLFYRDVSQTTLNNVEDITYSKGGVFQNFFDYGDLTLQTAGTAPNFDFHHIPDPEGSQQKIINLVTKYKKRQLNT